MRAYLDKLEARGHIFEVNERPKIYALAKPVKTIEAEMSGYKDLDDEGLEAKLTAEMIDESNGFFEDNAIDLRFHIGEKTYVVDGFARARLKMNKYSDSVWRRVLELYNELSLEDKFMSLSMSERDYMIFQILPSLVQLGTELNESIEFEDIKNSIGSRAREQEVFSVLPLLLGSLRKYRGDLGPRDARRRIQ